MTADCSPSWTSWTIKTYFSFKLFFLLPERKFYTYLIAFLLQKKYTKKPHGFRSFRGLLIHSLVTTRNKEFSSRNFGDQLLKNQIVQKFYLSGQIWYPILSLRETAVVRFELLQAKTKQFFFFWIAHFTSCSLCYNLVAFRINPFTEFSEGHLSRSAVCLKISPTCNKFCSTGW